MKAALSHHRNTGFTLVEVLISISLFAVILGGAYACLSAGFSTQKMVEPRADALQSARVALNLIAADLRSACALPGTAEFLGTQRTMGKIQADTIDFATHNYSPAREGEGDFCELSYFLDKNPRTGMVSLWRRRNPRIGVDPLSGGTREELVSGVRGLQFEYTDGIDWYDTWGEIDGKARQQNSLKYYGNLTGMPEAVRITLLLSSGENNAAASDKDQDKEPAPLVFRTVARLNLAKAASSGSSSVSEAGTGTPAAPDGGAPGSAPPPQ